MVCPLIVGLAVAYVALRQWKTAKEKLVLDLFDRRYSLFARAESALAPAMRDGDSRNNDSIRDIARLRSEARFLFGDEIEKYLGAIQEALAQLGLAHTMMAANNHEKDWPQLSHDCLLKVVAFYEEFPKLCAPYMKMTHKL